MVADSGRRRPLTGWQRKEPVKRAEVRESALRDRPGTSPTTLSARGPDPWVHPPSGVRVPRPDLPLRARSSAREASSTCGPDPSSHVQRWCGRGGEGRPCEPVPAARPGQVGKVAGDLPAGRTAIGLSAV